MNGLSNELMEEWTKRTMEEWMDYHNGRMDYWNNERMNGISNKLIEERTNGKMEQWDNEWTIKWTNGRMD